MPLPEPLPAELRLAPFHVREAFALGVSGARLRRRDLAAPFHGVRTSAPVDSIADRCSAFSPLLREGQCFSHSTAAALWGMWLPVRVLATDVIHVTTVGPGREPRMPTVNGHRAAPGSLELTMLDGIPVTAPTETWRLLSAELSVEELIVAGDSLVRRQYPRASLPELAEAVQRHRGRRGAVDLVRALPHVRAGTDSPQETRTRRLLLSAGFPEPVINPVVSRAGAAKTRYGDMVYPDYRVIVEYDGRHHQLSPRQHAEDVLRLEELAREGWIVIRVLAEHLRHPGSVVARVEDALVGRGWRPSRSSVRKLRLFQQIT